MALFIVSPPLPHAPVKGNLAPINLLPSPSSHLVAFVAFLEHLFSSRGDGHDTCSLRHLRSGGRGHGDGRYGTTPPHFF